MSSTGKTQLQVLVDAIRRKTTRLTSFFQAVGRTTRLQALVAAMQQKFGSRALWRLRGRTREVSTVSTGIQSLDAILDAGGIPRGYLTELFGAPTAGMTTVALTTIASAQSAGDTTAYIDLDKTFDPEYATHCGVVVSDLLLVRPKSKATALDVASDLIAGGGVGILALYCCAVQHSVFDSLSSLVDDDWNQWALPSSLRRLANTLSTSPCAFLVLTRLPPDNMYRRRDPDDTALAHDASLRLQFFRKRWCWDGHGIRLTGYESHCVVQKNKLGRPGNKATFTVTL